MPLHLSQEYDKIYNFCYFKVHNKQIAEDLTQDTFLKFFANNSYINKGKTLAYLYVIARNNCNDYFKEKTTEELKENSIGDYNINKSDLKLTVTETLKRLTVDEQELILLRFTNELKINEIASYLGISRFAVNRRLSSIIKKLKKHLREEDFYE